MRVLACAAALLLSACQAARGPANILLITVDTLRADHLSAWGYPRRTSPVLDRLAAEGVRFDQAWAQWPKTGPSFASILTASYPKDNGIVRKIGIPLPRGLRLLSESLQAAGYGTYAVVSNGALGREYHFDQGFDRYIETWKLPERTDGLANDQAEVVNEQAFALLAAIDRSKPYFLWVHYLDPHFPYEPPPAWRDRFQNDEQFEHGEQIHVDWNVGRLQMGGIGAAQVLDRRRDLGFYVTRYDAEIAYTDAQIGLLLERLREAGLLDDTLTVMTADHGESLGEHRYFFDHGRFGFETCLHVPLVFHFPGVLEPRVDADPVELIDVAPTIMEFARLPLEGGQWLSGHSLTPRLRGTGEPATGPVYARAEAGYGTEGRWQKIVRDQRYKLIYVPLREAQRHVGGWRQPFGLYDLVEDPGEETNLMGQQDEVFERLKDEMIAWWKPESVDVLLDGDSEEEEEAPAEETLEQLRALGYIE